MGQLRRNLFTGSTDILKRIFGRTADESLYADQFM